MNYTYKVEDIFEDIPGDDENVLMNIPPEILKEVGWKEGDTLCITAESGIISLRLKED